MLYPYIIMEVELISAAGPNNRDLDESISFLLWAKVGRLNSWYLKEKCSYLGLYIIFI